MRAYVQTRLQPTHHVFMSPKNKHNNHPSRIEYQPAEQQIFYKIFNRLETAAHVNLITAPITDAIGAACLLARAFDKVDKSYTIHFTTDKTAQELALETDPKSISIGLGVTLPKIVNDSSVETEEVDIIDDDVDIPDSYHNLSAKEIGKLVGSGKGINPVLLTTEGETERLDPRRKIQKQTIPTPKTTKKTSDPEPKTEMVETETVDELQVESSIKESEQEQNTKEQTEDDSEKSIKETDDVPIFNPGTNNKNSNKNKSNNSSKQSEETTNNDSKSNKSQKKKFTSDVEVVSIGTSKEKSNEDNKTVDTNSNKSKQESEESNQNNVIDTSSLPQDTITHPDVVPDFINEKPTETKEQPIDYPHIEQTPVKQSNKFDSKNEETEEVTDGGKELEPAYENAGETINVDTAGEPLVTEVSQFCKASNVFHECNSWLVAGFTYTNTSIGNKQMVVSDDETIPWEFATLGQHYEYIAENTTKKEGLGLVTDSVTESLTGNTYVHGVFSGSARGLAKLISQSDASPPPNVDDGDWDETVKKFKRYIQSREYNRDESTPHLERFLNHHRIDDINIDVSDELITFEGFADVIETLSSHSPQTIIDSFTDSSQNNETDIVDEWLDYSKKTHKLVSSATETMKSDEVTVYNVPNTNEYHHQVARLIHDSKSTTKTTVVTTDSKHIVITYEENAIEYASSLVNCTIEIHGNKNISLFNHEDKNKIVDMVQQ